MIESWFASGWFWLSMALILLALEAIMPGAFMLWFGLAAGATFIVDLIFPGMSGAAEWLVFAAFSMVSVGIGWWWQKNRQGVDDTDQPLLNRRDEQLVGRVLNLESAITNGRGRVKVDDAFWTVLGDDMPAQSRVRVVSVRNMELVVEAA